MRTVPLLLALAVACGGKDGSEPATSDGTPADTGFTLLPGTTSSDPDVTDGMLILPCEDLAFVESCAAVSDGADVCSDYFGSWTDESIRRGCESAGGTIAQTACVLPDRIGSCVFYDPGAPDYCYVEHVTAADDDPSDDVASWEAACPAAGGTWQPR